MKDLLLEQYHGPFLPETVQLKPAPWRKGQWDKPPFTYDEAAERDAYERSLEG